MSTLQHRLSLRLLQPAGIVQRPACYKAQATPKRKLVTFAATQAPVAEPTPSKQAVKPALLAGTPASFPIPPEKLIELAKKVHATDTGVSDESVLADDFRFEFPIVKIGKEEYLKNVRSFQLRTAFPDLCSNAYDFRVDPYEPNRVWFTIRTTGTHTGTLRFGRSEYPATGKVLQGGPECCSYVFNEEGKVKCFTGGYVMDNQVGNFGGYGAAFGILSAIGIQIPKPNSVQWELAIFINSILQALDKVFKK